MVGDYVRKRENKWISTSKNRGGGTNLSRKTNGLVQVKQGFGTNLRKREKKCITTAKIRGGETNLRKREQMD